MIQRRTIILLILMLAARAAIADDVATPAAYAQGPGGQPPEQPDEELQEPSRFELRLSGGIDLVIPNVTKPALQLQPFVAATATFHFRPKWEVYLQARLSATPAYSSISGWSANLSGRVSLGAAYHFTDRFMLFAELSLDRKHNRAFDLREAVAVTLAGRAGARFQISPRVKLEFSGERRLAVVSQGLRPPNEGVTAQATLTFGF